MKTILGTGDLKTLRNVGRASLVAMMAGSDFIKTSTGKEGVNATLPVALVMVRAIRAYREMTGHVVGFKPAGGISTAKDAMTFQFVMKEELGNDWLQPGLFRIGASSLLSDIERQLEYYVTGRYASFDHHGAGVRGTRTMSIAEILDTMDYGPAPESDTEARAWIAKHGEGTGLFINGAWRKPKSGAWFDTSDPSTGAVIMRVAQAGDGGRRRGGQGGAQGAGPAWARLPGHERARNISMPSPG